MSKSLMGFVSALLATVSAFAMDVQSSIETTEIPKFIKVIWEGHEYVTTDEKEIQNIMKSDLINDPKVIIKKGEVSASQPTTISVVKER